MFKIDTKITYDGSLDGTIEIWRVDAKDIHFKIVSDKSGSVPFKDVLDFLEFLGFSVEVPQWYKLIQELEDLENSMYQ